MVQPKDSPEKSLSLRKLAWWLPALQREDRYSDEARHSLMVSAAALCAIPMCLIYSIAEINLGYPLMATALLAGALLSLAIYFATRTTNFKPIYARTLVCYFAIMMFVQILLDRGQFTLFHLFLIPPVTFFMFGQKEGLIWSGTIFVLALIPLLIPEVFNVSSLAGGEPDFIAVYLTISVFAGLFESVRNRAQQRFENHRLQLEQEHSQLLAAQSRLSLSEQRFRTFSDLASDWLFEMDETLTFTFATPRLEELVGGKVVGKRIQDLSAELEGTGRAVEPLSQGKAITNQQISFRNYPGQRIVALFNAMPLTDPSGGFRGYIGAGKDITPIQEAQEAMREKDQALHHLQKLEALDQLTSGIAHDFNNLLTVIGGNLELVDWNQIDKADQVKLGAASRAVERAAVLTNQLLSFSRKQDLTPQSISVHELLSNLSDMFARTLTNTITIKQNFAPDVARCFADEGQLENALLNLVLNARDAMQGRGEMTLSASNINITERDDTLGIAPGQYIAISVEDNGVGIDSDQLTRIMEPFYTTKPVGEGTGLGLSMVYGFAKQSGGQLTVTSRPGEGSTFTLYLPGARTHAQAEVLATPITEREHKTRQLVLIEDEPEVQKILILSLERSGFEVKAFNAAAPALAYLNDHKPDLVVSDLVLGSDINGAEVAEQARSVYPELPFLLISGNADHVLSKDQIEEYADALLRKPFTSAQLRTAVEKLLT